MGLPGLWLFLIAVITASVSLAVAGVWLANRVLDRPGEKVESESLSSFITAAALVYGALLGFTVVVAWEQFSSAAANVTDESSTVATMYRQTINLDPPEQAAVRGLLRDYATAVQSEWDREDDDPASNTAQSAITDMYRALGNRQPPLAAVNPINAEIRSELNTLASQRNTRLLDATPRIPGLLWGTLIFGGVLLIALTGLARLQDRRVHMAMSSAVAVLLGLLLFLVFWLDHPFGRQLGVTPASFDYTTQVFEQVDQSN